MNRTQRKRLWWRSGFFALFLLAPALDLFRLDLVEGHFIVLRHAWTLGLDGDGTSQAWQVLVRVFLPVGTVLAIGGWVSWRYGRLYCSWLCPHFSVVEGINALMRRASGRLSVWESRRLPEQQCDGRENRPRAWLWSGVVIAAVGLALLWAVTLLTYLLPPARVWDHLVHLRPTRNEALFIGVASLLFTADFLFARHLFCRYGCALGLAQSVVWMGNAKAMVVGFDRQRARACARCDASCEHACPMRLTPRLAKHRLIACTQCQQCIEACDRVQSCRGEPGLLTLVSGKAALDKSSRSRPGG